MARRGRPTVEISLSADERSTLQRWAQRHSSSQALALRSKIVLACAAGDRDRTPLSGPPVMWAGLVVVKRRDPAQVAAVAVAGILVLDAQVEILEAKGRGR